MKCCCKCNCGCCCECCCMEEKIKKICKECCGCDGTGDNNDNNGNNNGNNGGNNGEGEWVRPSNRPDVPDIAEDEQVIYWLFGVQEAAPNDFAIQLATSSGQYAIEWGDGTSDTYNGNTKAEHLFDFASISGEPNKLGYKWVWIKAYPIGGNFTTITINVRHSLRPAGSSKNIFAPQVFEWYMRAPEVTSFTSGNYTYYMMLEIFDYMGANKIKDFSSFLNHSYNLKELNVYTGGGTNFYAFLWGCCSFNQQLNIDTSKTSGNFTFFMWDCTSYNKPLNIDTSGGGSLTNFMLGCYSFNQPLKLDIKGAINLETLYALKDLRLAKGSVADGIDISNTSLDVPALVNLFGDLYDRKGLTAGKLTLTGVYGASRLTAEQKSIATAKNWTLVI